MSKIAGQLQTDEKREWRKTHSRAKKLLKAHEIALNPYVFTEIHHELAHDYRRSMPLQISGLAGPLPW